MKLDYLPKDLDPKLVKEEEKIAKAWKEAEEGKRNYLNQLIEMGKNLLKNEK